MCFAPTFTKGLLISIMIFFFSLVIRTWHVPPSGGELFRQLVVGILLLFGFCATYLLIFTFAHVTFHCGTSYSFNVVVLL